MKTLALFALFFGVLGLISPGLAVERVGLTKVAMEADERIWGFEVRLEGGRIVGVLAIPDGWKITAENYGEAAEYKEGGGEVCGNADFGHDALTAEDLPRLSGFLLIERSKVDGRSATLTGTITLSGPKGNRTLRLGPESFSRVETSGVSHTPSAPAAAAG